MIVDALHRRELLWRPLTGAGRIANIVPGPIFWCFELSRHIRGAHVFGDGMQRKPAITHPGATKQGQRGTMKQAPSLVTSGRAEGRLCIGCFIVGPVDDAS